jgi:hypothetical protein
MMGIRAYVLIETAMGRSREVSLALHECPWVEHVERVAGPYDIVAIARGDGFCDLDGVVNEGLKPIDGVIRAVVCQVSSLLEGSQAATAVATL